MSKRIYCIASYKPRDGKFEALFKTLQALEPETRKEAGCIQYVVTKHIPHPNAPGTTSLPIVFNEVWESKEAFEDHCATKHITDFFQSQCIDKTGLVEEFNVCVYSDE